MGTWCNKFLGACTMYIAMYRKGVAQMIKDRSHTASRAMWAYHLYPLAMVELPISQGVMYKKT